MRVPSHPLRRIFRPDTPVETFGLVPPASCTTYSFVPVILAGASILMVAAIVAKVLP
jgi:hypothetical protein